MSKKPKPITLEQTAKSGLGELLEVVLFAPQGASEQDFLLGADVRFGTAVLASEDWSKSIEIGLSRASLTLDLLGCKIDPSTNRFGDQKPASSKTRTQHTQTKNQGVDAKIALGASARHNSIPVMTAETKLGLDHKNGSQLSSTETFDGHRRPVVALSGNRWLFESVTEDYMRSRYSGDEILCKVQINTWASSVRVDARLTFQPKDIVIVDVESQARSLLDRFKKSPNKAAIAKILLSRYLREINESHQNTSPGAIIGWASTLEGEV